MPTKFAVLSTYPPTQCGIATFSAALVDALQREGEHTGVVSVVDDTVPAWQPEVVHQWRRGQADGARLAAAALDGHDVAIIEHEFGIFGGEDGCDVLDVVAATSVPTIVVLHTVPTTPTAYQRHILDVLMARADRTVVMTRAARERLIDVYGADPANIAVIPHGAPDLHRQLPPRRWPLRRSRPIVLTWGLLGPGKGIEWGIEAIARLKGTRPMPRYLIVGETHPKVAARDGEHYREQLRALAYRRGLGETVSFDGRYHPTHELFRIANAADIVLLPYDSPDQVTSGVLAEAVALGKPVIASGFPHAKELLASGAGIVVDRKSPEAIAHALRRALGEPRLLERMAAEARRIAPQLWWSTVAQSYRDLALEIVGHPRPIGVVT